MAQSTFSLSWEMHRNNICNGLSALQQNGEFVDMTLAADGHHVKVHQMVMALASPYIKELIRSAACPHPVIFLNKMSYSTLTTILEYIYTGEVLVAVEHLSDLVQAARELHIKGLEDMGFQESMSKHVSQQSSIAEEDCNTENVDEEICYFEVTDARVNTPSQKSNYSVLYEDGNREDSDITMEDNNCEEIVQEITDETVEKKPKIVSCSPNLLVPDQPESNVQSAMQYTVSNQGSLQMILNRYVYYMKHCNRNNSRQWRCVDYLNLRKCPAVVITKDDVVVQRISAHTHPFHDKRILKKVYAGAVFRALHDAERQGKDIKSKSKDKTGECQN